MDEALRIRERKACQVTSESRRKLGMWELDYKESRAPKNWCFWSVVLEKTLESPLDCKEIQPVRSEGDQSWMFIGRADTEAETPILWPSDVKNWLIGKDPDAGKDWRQEEKGTTEDEMVGRTWVRVSSGSWWWTWRSGVLQSTGSRRVRHDWAELRQADNRGTWGRPWVLSLPVTSCALCWQIVCTAVSPVSFLMFSDGRLSLSALSKTPRPFPEPVQHTGGGWPKCFLWLAVLSWSLTPPASALMWLAWVSNT